MLSRIYNVLGSCFCDQGLSFVFVQIRKQDLLLDFLHNEGKKHLILFEFLGSSRICPERKRYLAGQLAQECFQLCLPFKYFLINVYKIINNCTFLHIIPPLILQLQIVQQKQQSGMKTNQQQRRKIDADERGNALMTVRTIKYYCSKDELFETPELNEKLYLHFKGFRKIQNLHHYPNLVTIWLNNNSISRIQGLSGLNNLICLYLNNNVIERIENLEGLHKLAILHLAHNRIEKIEGLKQLKSLSTINVSQNFLITADSIAGLKQSASLTSIDLSKNDIQCTQALFNIVSSLKNISCLIMKNTPLTKSYKNYRKKLTAALPKLQYLDDRPVKDVDHRLAEAWIKGGPEMENQEKAKIAAEIQQKNKRQSKQLSQKIIREKKREEQLRNLEQQKKKLQGESDNQQNAQHIQRINNRIELLKQGPKGFQAAITQTSIKILQVNEEDQQKIINRYFYNQKMKIQQNLRKIKKQSDPNLSVKQICIGEDEKIIQKKVRKAVGLNNEKQFLMKVNCLSRWHNKYEPILEALLEKDKFNFQVVHPQFNHIVADINKKMMRSFTKWSQRELEHIWTHIHQSRIDQNQQKVNKKQQKQ